MQVCLIDLHFGKSTWYFEYHKLSKTNTKVKDNCSCSKSNFRYSCSNNDSSITKYNSSN